MPEKRKLTPQQVLLIRNIVKGMTLGEAAVNAGYSENNPGQSGWQALQQIKDKMPAILDRHGLTDDALIEKYLRPALEAQETEFAKFEGKITDRVDVIAWEPRLKALDMAFSLKGSYAPKEISGADGGPLMVLVNPALETKDD